MKSFQLFFTILLSCSVSFAQSDISKIKDSILAEGQTLYKSEMASWYGTDLFLEKYSDKSNIGGYFSYTDNNISKCIFFSKGEDPSVIGTIVFDSSYEIKTAQLNLDIRKFTKNENDLFIIRSNALKIINSDTLFIRYDNTSLNLIPIISNGEKKVYVLTGPKANGVVIFGNDYLLRFDNNNVLINKKHLHKNIIPIDYGEKGNSTEVFGTMHTHLPETGDFITATDICTLMLYEKFAKWEQHIVASDKYYSIWDCKKNIFFTLTKEAWDRIYKDKKD